MPAPLDPIPDHLACGPSRAPGKPLDRNPGVGAGDRLPQRLHRAAIDMHPVKQAVNHRSVAHTGDAAAADATVERRELIKRSVDVKHGHGTRRCHGRQGQRTRHRRDRGDHVGGLRGHPVGHHAAVRHPRGMHAAAVDGCSQREVGDHGAGEADVVRVLVAGLAAAVAAVPGEQALPRARAGRVDDHCPPRSRVVVEPGKPPHHLRMALSAVKGDHQRPARGRGRCGRDGGHRVPTAAVMWHVNLDRGE